MNFLARAVSKMHPLEIMFRVLLISVGGLLYLFAAWFAVESLRIIATHDTATAEVTRSFAEGSPGTRFQTYRIEAKFATDRGNHRTEISTASTKYEPGDRITIYYQMDTAYKSKLGGFWGLWFTPLMIAIIGSILMFFALKPNKKEQTA